MFFGLEGPERGVGVGAYFSLSLRGREAGWGWALIKFFCLQDRRLFEVGANSRLDAYSNKYGNGKSYKHAYVIQLHQAVTVIVNKMVYDHVMSSTLFEQV